MRPEEFYLRDIILASKSSESFVSEISRDLFDSSDLHQSAVLFKLMIIGEAAAHISHRIRQKYSEVDWQSLKGFRNIIAHEYFSLDLDIVWDSARNDSVVLMEQIEHILETEYPEFPRSA